MTDSAPGRPAPGALLIFIGLQLGQVMSTLDGTIVATALPTITDDLGGFSRVTWVITAYTLAVVASMPLYGKLGDLYGRKRILIVAISIFLVASAACGAAQTMNQLLAARFVQGLGGGGLATLAMAAIADIVPARQLGRWLGYQGVIFAISSVAGPVLGGLFVDHLSWRWAFYVNLPVGAVAITIIATKLRLPYRRIPHALDWLGSATLTSGLACLVLVATLGGRELPWRSAQLIALVAAALTLFAVFLWQEQRAPEPVLPLRIIRDPVMRMCVGVNFTSGMLLWCGIFFVPLFVQEVRGVTPTRAGFVLMPLMFSTAVGTLISGRRVERTGRYRVWPLTGSVVMLVGMGLLATVGSTRRSLAVAGVRLRARHRRRLRHAAVAPRRPEQRAAARPRHRDVDRAAVPLARQHHRHPDLRRHPQRRAGRPGSGRGRLRRRHPDDLPGRGAGGRRCRSSSASACPNAPCGRTPCSRCLPPRSERSVARFRTIRVTKSRKGHSYSLRRAVVICSAGSWGANIGISKVIVRSSAVQGNGVS